MRWRFRRTIAVVVLLVPLVAGISGQDRRPESGKRDDPELSAILERTAARVRQYVVGLQHLAWTSVVRHEVLDKDGRAIKTDKPREVTYETIVKLKSFPAGSDSVVAPVEESELKLVDGRPVKPNYKLPWHYPSPQVGFPSFFLIPESYSFSYAGHADLRGHDALLVDILQAPQEKVPRANWGRDRYLLSVSGIPMTGRVWIDPETFDVLQVDLRTGPAELGESDKTHNKFRYERRWTMRYKSMTFDNPEQGFLVPESWEVETLLDGESPALRREVRTFKAFRRFIGEVRVTPADD